MTVKGRQHPIKLFSYTTKYFWLLIIPVLRSLYAIFFEGDSWEKWITGAWLDLLVLAAIIGFAWLRWSSVEFSFDDKSLTVHKGIFFTVSEQVFYPQISTISIYQGFLYRALGACTVKIGTNAGVLDKADVSIVMKKSDADKFYQAAKASRVKSLNYSVSPNKLRLLLFSFIFSSSFSGVAIMIALLLEAGSMIDRRAEAQLILNTLTDALNKAATYVPPILAGVALFVGVTWIFSFVNNIFYFWDHILTKCSDTLYIRSGLIAERRDIISLDKINFIDFRQNLLARLFKISSLSIHAAGFGGTGRSEMSVIMPITTKKELGSTILEVFPEYPMPKITMKSDIKSYKGFYVWPFLFFVIPLCGFWALKAFAPEWYAVAEPAMLISLIPAVWLTIVKTAALFSTGIGFEKNYISLRYAKFLAFHTVIMPKNRIAKIQLRQSLFQRLNGTCTLKIYSTTDSKKVHRIHGLRMDRLMNTLDQNGYDLYFTENPEG